MAKSSFTGISQSLAACLALLVGMVGLVTIGGCQSGTDTDQATVADTSDGELLLNAAQVKTAAENVDAQDAGEIRILDVRSESDYTKGHVPGALWMNFSNIAAIAKQENGMHDADAWSAALTPLGITTDTRVVVYGGGSVPTTTRAWWLLKYVGVKDVAILNGGIDAWTAAGFEPSTATHAYQSREFAADFQRNLLVEISELKERLKDQQVRLLDTRSEAEFTGEQARAARGGRIPGAEHLNWTELVDDSGRFKSKQELRALFESRGALPENECITYCQSGGRASAEAFALELLGYQNVRIYYASWQEWGADESAEIQQGPDNKSDK